MWVCLKVAALAWLPPADIGSSTTACIRTSNAYCAPIIACCHSRFVAADTCSVAKIGAGTVLRLHLPAPLVAVPYTHTLARKQWQDGPFMYVV